MNATKDFSRGIRITWVDAAGNAACIGLDEEIVTSWTDDEILAAALDHASEQDVDLDRYHPEIEVVVEF